jgi:RHS repeat-associated protein
VKKDVNGKVNWFVYDFTKILSDVLAEYDNSGILLASYSHGAEIDNVISMRKNNKSYYYLTDGLGSITSIIDHSESQANTYLYDSYGSVIQKTESVSNPYGYTGRRLDDESGLMYYRARYYSPDIGRFITADPIGFLAGINLYTYSSNNPISYTDPTGKLAILAFLGVVAGIIGAILFVVKTTTFSWLTLLAAVGIMCAITKAMWDFFVALAKERCPKRKKVIDDAEKFREDVLQRLQSLEELRQNPRIQSAAENLKNFKFTPDNLSPEDRKLFENQPYIMTPEERELFNSWNRDDPIGNFLINRQLEDLRRKRE